MPDLLDPAVLERAAAEGELAGLVARWTAEAAGDEPRRAVLAALRLDLALVVREPELLFQCVYNRVYWHASAEAAAFYGEGATRSAAAGVGGALAGCARRARVVGALAAAAGVPAAGAAARGVPRGAARRRSAGVLARRPDRGVRGPTATAWERATGRALPPDLAAQQFDDGRPELEARGDAWGRAQVHDRRSGASLVDVDVDGDSKFDCAIGLADGTAVIAAGWCQDYDGVIARIDLASGKLRWLTGAKVRWRVQIGGQIYALACDRAGALVAASDGAAIHLLDGTSGATLVSAPLTAHALALSPDGSTLVTRHEDVLRVWDVAALRRGRPTRLRGTHEGWIDAAFSPNGQRLITGKLLCDGRDGRLVARLGLDGPGYLEGGPRCTGAGWPTTASWRWRRAGWRCGTRSTGSASASTTTGITFTTRRSCCRPTLAGMSMAAARAGCRSRCGCARSTTAACAPSWGWSIGAASRSRRTAGACWSRRARR
ncbi:WD40 repeat domain-containing protein [Nannocystis pusilla]|uniref:WD40 repeat domain-containing protein n=1 Tax=Nannocystis pusilla TaxID=889268 RepID=UPI003B788AA2